MKSGRPHYACYECTEQHPDGMAKASLFEYYVENKELFIGGIVEEIHSRWRQSRDGYYCYNNILQDISLDSQGHFTFHIESNTLGGQISYANEPYELAGWHYFRFYTFQFRITDKNRNGIRRRFHAARIGRPISELKNDHVDTELIHNRWQDWKPEGSELNLRLFTNLKQLNLSNTAIPHVAKQLALPESLSCLLLSECELEELPGSIREIAGLEILMCSENPLVYPWETMGHCTQLKVVVAESCRITEIPDSVERLVELEELDLRNNNLSRISPRIEHLARLMKLDLSYNEELEELPDEIGALTGLRELDITGTSIRKLPDSFFNLRLSLLSLPSEMKQMPEQLLRMKSLRRIYAAFLEENKQRLREEIPECNS